MRHISLRLLFIGSFLLSLTPVYVQAASPSAAPSVPLNTPPTALMQQFDESGLRARADQVFRFVACDRENVPGDGGDFAHQRASPHPASSEDLMTSLLAKVMTVNEGRGCVDPDPAAPQACAIGLTRYCLTQQINEVVSKLQVTTQLGSSGIPCPPSFDGTEGEYDVGLRGLVWIMYNFPPRTDGFGLAPDTYRHVRDELLTVVGRSPYASPSDYTYPGGGCGNHEKQTGTPAAEVGQFQAVVAVCEVLGLAPDDCNSAAAAGNKNSTHCSPKFLCDLVKLFMLFSSIPIGIGTAVVLAGLGVPPPLNEYLGAKLGVSIAKDNAGAVMDLVPIPETENHIFMIESARFLINNLKQRDYECTDMNLKPFVCDPDAYGGPSILFDNDKNGQGQWVLDMLQRPLKHDFIEYNARPYQRYATLAIQNLYDMACALQNPCTGINLKVKVAAAAVLDYESAKFAVSSSTLKRLAPWRRLTDHKFRAQTFFTGYDDFQALRFAMFMGTLGFPANAPDAPFCVEGTNDQLCPEFMRGAWVELVSTAVSHYRVPPMLAQLVEPIVSHVPGVVGPVDPNADLSPRLGMATGCTDYLQRFHHAGEEIYDCGRTFLISAGGKVTPSAYMVLGLLGREADTGIALPTTLMPHGEGLAMADFIRFEGGAENSPNLCVDRDFACGRNLVIPDAYLDPTCHEQMGDWHMIDATHCPGILADFYVAAWMHTDDALTGASGNFGAFEVADAHSISFADFTARLLQQNEGPAAQWQINGDNTYTRVNGDKVIFVPGDAKIVGPQSNLLAEGDVIWADGTGCVLINNPVLNQSLVLSMVNIANPYIVFRAEQVQFGSADPLCTQAGDYREAYLYEE